ncbi:MAG: hypothetical protein AAFQ44_10400, partial [Pseudomonadota bacterium]
LRDRLGALLFLAVIPCAYLMAGIGLGVNGADLAGQGVFPGQYMMAGYISLCIITVFAALRAMRRQTRGALSF